MCAPQTPLSYPIRRADGIAIQPDTLKTRQKVVRFLLQEMNKGLDYQPNPLIVWCA